MADTSHLPQWVTIITALGIPTLLGALIGIIASFATYKLNSNKDDKKWRQSISEQILQEVYSYNGVAVNILIFFPSKPEMLIEAVDKVNRAAALADLYVNDKVHKSVETLIILVGEIKNEIEKEIKSGKSSGSRHDLESGKKYDEELKKLKNHLKEWIEKS